MPSVVFSVERIAQRRLCLLSFQSLCESLNFGNGPLKCVCILNAPAGMILAVRRLSRSNRISVEQAGQAPFGIPEPA